MIFCKCRYHLTDLQDQYYYKEHTACKGDAIHFKTPLVECISKEVDVTILGRVLYFFTGVIFRGCIKAERMSVGHYMRRKNDIHIRYFGRILYTREQLLKFDKDESSRIVDLTELDVWTSDLRLLTEEFNKGRVA